MTVELARARRHSSNGARDAPFRPGRRKEPTSAGVGAGAAAGAGANVSTAARKTGKEGWKALRHRLMLGNCVARLSVPCRTKLDVERLHKKAGSTISSEAKTDRWDVQTVYRELFFLPSEDQKYGFDPWAETHDTEHRIGGEFIVNDEAVIRRARSRLHALSTLKRKFKRTLHAQKCGDADWSAIFSHYDTDGSGGLGLDELASCIRWDANISEDQLSDFEIDQLFKYIDSDGSGEISVEEFIRFMNTPIGMAQKSTTSWMEVYGGFGRGQQKPHTFVAEYIALARVPLRAACFVDSDIIGYIEKGEVVVVTHVWGGNELNCRRLRWHHPRDNMVMAGWTSHRGRLKPTDRFSELLCRLDKNEWSSISMHHTRIADRVSLLQTQARLAKKVHEADKKKHRYFAEVAGQPASSESEQVLGEQREQRRIRRVYASIDRALVLHQIAASKLGGHARLHTGLDASAEEQKHLTAQTESKTKPVPPSISGGSAAAHITPKRPTKTVVMQTTSEARTLVVSTGVAKQRLSLPASPRGDDCTDSSCANPAWHKPTPPPDSATNARCSSPPPRAGRVQRIVASR